MTSARNTPKSFYNAQYMGDRYAAYSAPESHSFHAKLKELLAQYGRGEGRWLEVGCGRGLLQDVVVDYTGVDLAGTVATYLHKPFRCAPAEALPFEDDVFDGAWSYAVLEHVDDPEKALAEMRRVLKPGGILILAPAWHCRSWAGRDYAWTTYGELSLPDRIRKASIPLRNSIAFRALSILPVRLFHFLAYLFLRSPTPFRSRRLKPDYSEYRVVDADARHAMDPFEAILWFRSRGDSVLAPAGWRRELMVRAGALVVRKA
jgi:SAM-dependent methyltransferase